MTDYFNSETYNETLSYLHSVLPPSFHSMSLGVVCGSGLGGLVDCFTGSTISLDYKDIPHFPVSSVQGHAGKLVFGTIHGVKTICMLGRLHLYEGHEPVKSVFPIRIMHLLNVQTLIVTNAAGGLNPSYNIGDFMIISDHVSFAGMGGNNPLIGPNTAFGPRFPPISSIYDFKLRLIAAKAAKELNLRDSIREGVYCFVAGPSFESRAEARFLRDGCKTDCVGMSTVPEVVTAGHCGMLVLGLSLITNKVAAGVGTSALDVVFGGAKVEMEEGVASHEEVLETSRVRSIVFKELIDRIISKMNN